MKTAMDAAIRQTQTRSFRDTDRVIRQTASIRISGASVLREEVLSELPDQYRKALLSMSLREREKLLSKVETSVNRKISRGAMAKTAIKLDDRERAEKQKAAVSGSREVRRQAIADKYRIPTMQSRAGPGNMLMSVPADNPQLQRYLKDASRLHCKSEAVSPADHSSEIAEHGLDVLQEPMHRGFMRTMSDGRSYGGAFSAVSPASPESLEGQPDRKKALQDQYILQHSDRGSSGPSDAGQCADVRARKNSSDTENNPSKMIDMNNQDISNNFDEMSDDGTASEQIAEELADALSAEVKKVSAKTKAAKAAAEKAAVTATIEQTASAAGEGADEMGAVLSQYQEQLLNTVKTQKEKRQIQASMQKAIARKAGKKEQEILYQASRRAAFASGVSSDAYRQMLAEAGLQTDEQKAAVQMAYEKQLRKTMKAAYRKELIGKLSKQKTQALMKKAEQKKYQNDQAQESESNRAMTDQMRFAAGAMSAGTKALKRVAEDAAKAVKTLVQKKLILLIIPVILIAAIPIVMVAFPLISAVTTTSYEDNEVYAYTDASELIAYAQQWIGKIPYVWGGGHGGSATAWQSGCDCSGFVHGVFNHFGYEIGGDTGAMETQAGTHIAYDSLASAKPGDVIIYYRTGAHVKGDPNGSGSTHVSIYEGNNRIIHQAGGVHESTEYHQYFEVRRVLTADVAGRGNITGGLGGMGTYGHRTDGTNYSTSDLQLIWAIVAQEDNGSYKGALAVISTAMNRVESPQWSYEGSNALAQLTAPGQFCYSNDHYWEARLGGNVPDYVKQAVNDCLKKGKRNHSHTSFRSTKGKVTGDDAVQIGGNWYFG